jgi:hypothetical protein
MPKRGLDRDDVEQLGEAGKISRIARIQGQIGGHGGCGNQQVRRPATACLSAGRGDRGIHAAVRASHVGIHRKRLERRFGALQPILTPRSFSRMVRGVWARREFGQSNWGDCKFTRQTLRIDYVQVYHHRGVDQASRMTGVSHAASDPG